MSAAGQERTGPRVLLVDAANVVGSRPTGWWRDRAGAARGLHGRLLDALRSGALEPPVVLVLEGKARDGVEEGTVDGLEVVHARGQGDDTLTALARSLTTPVTLVSADRGLAERVLEAGGDVVGPSWLLAQLPGRQR